MAEATTFFEGQQVDAIDTWMPTDPREKTFLSYIKKDGKEIVSRSRAFLAYPKKMKSGISIFYSPRHYFYLFLVGEWRRGQCCICQKMFFNKTAVMFVYQHLENQEKSIYESNDLACLLHFTMFGVDMKRTLKKRKIDMDEDESVMAKPMKTLVTPCLTILAEDD